MPIATLTSKGQVTIPAETRRLLRIGPGSRINFSVNSAGETVLRVQKSDVQDLKGVLKSSGSVLSAADMDDAMAAAIYLSVQSPR